MSILSDKVALVTGGASGIGLKYVEELLKKNVKGVVIVDINAELGEAAVAKLGKEYGENKILFQMADVSDKNSLKRAFDATIEKFNQLDIVINNAGIMNDSIWEKQIDINTKGVVNGTLLALEFLPKYKKDENTYIMNISSILGLDGGYYIPVYSATKSFIISLTRNMGAPCHYERTKVKVMAICPGATDTSLIERNRQMTLGPEFQKMRDDRFQEFIIQSPSHVAKGLISVLEKGESGSVWVIEDNECPFEVEHLSRDQLRKK